jgi:hypothetical protein
VWADAPLEVTVAAFPDPALAVGNGDVVTLTLTYSNTGTAVLPQLTFNGSDTGGVNLSNAPQTATNIPAGGNGTLTLLGTVTGNGTVNLTLSDSYHRPYAMGIYSYTVDTVPPISLSLALAYAGPLTNTIVVNANDVSAIASMEVEVDDGLGLFSLLATQTVSCTPSSGSGNGFVCPWQPSSVTEGQSFTLRTRATDIHGNTSGWSDPITVIGDINPPTLQLSTGTLSALSDDQINQKETGLTGTLTDNRRAVRTEVCLAETITMTTCVVGEVKPDNTWAATLPNTYDGVTRTLAVVGFDAAGNASTPYTQEVWLDTVAPVISTTVQPGYVQLITGTVQSFTLGKVVDASLLANARVLMILPDGSLMAVPGTVTGNDWVVGYEFAQVGIYTAVLQLRDGAGNLSVSEVWRFRVDYDPTAVTLSHLALRSDVATTPALLLLVALWLGLLTALFWWRHTHQRRQV